MDEPIYGAKYYNGRVRGGGNCYRWERRESINWGGRIICCWDLGHPGRYVVMANHLQIEEGCREGAAYYTCSGGRSWVKLFDYFTKDIRKARRRVEEVIKYGGSQYECYPERYV